MLHIKAFIIGTAVVLTAICIILGIAFAAKTFGIIILAVPFAIFFVYSIGRMCLEIWGGQFR